MRNLTEKEMRTVSGGKKYKCGNCGKKVNSNPVSRAWHWVTKGCWGYF